MTTFNRRTLIRNASAGAAVIAFAPRGLLRAQPADGDRSFESVLTGSAIDLVDEQWDFNPHLYSQGQEGGVTREYVSLGSLSATVEVEFLQPPQSASEHLTKIKESYTANYDSFEVGASGVTSDGEWFAASALYEDFALSIYCEYQAGAYEDTDLVVILNSRPNAFHENLPALQGGVLIGDLEPMMMVETSQAMSLAFPVLAVATPTQAPGGSSRSTRSSPGSNNSSTSSRSNRDGQSTSATDNDYVDSVISHRTEFLSSYDDFFSALMQFANEDSTDAQLNEAFSAIGDIATIWVTYPNRAGQLVAPPQYQNLGTLYQAWADEIASLGTAWRDAVSGTSEFGDMFDQMDVVTLADDALAAELNSL